MSRDHRKLRAFELADRVAELTYVVTRSFPRDERFGLTSQMRRAGISAPANIVEGCGRRTQREYLRFLDISLGSLRELGYFLDLSLRLGFTTESAISELRRTHDEASRVLAALIRAIDGGGHFGSDAGYKPPSPKPQA